MHACMLSRFSHVPVFATPWTVVRQAPLSMRFSSQKYWSGLPCPSPGNLPDPGIEPVSPSAPTLQADSLPLRHQGSPHMYIHVCIYAHLYVCLCMHYLNIYICIPTCVCVWVCIFRSLCSQYTLFFPSSLLSHIFFSLLINSSTNWYFIYSSSFTTNNIWPLLMPPKLI